MLREIANSDQMKFANIGVSGSNPAPVISMYTNLQLSIYINFTEQYIQLENTGEKS